AGGGDRPSPPAALAPRPAPFASGHPARAVDLRPQALAGLATAASGGDHPTGDAGPTTRGVVAERARGRADLRRAGPDGVRPGGRPGRAGRAAAAATGA